MRRRAARAWSRGALVGLLALAPLVAGAGASSANDGQWWYDQMGIAAANAAGADGNGVVIAMIDRNINMELFAGPSGTGPDIQVHEPSFCRLRGTDQYAEATSPLMTGSVYHGTTTAAMVVGLGLGSQVRGVAPHATLRFYSVGIPADDGRMSGCAITSALLQAVSDGAKIVTTSIGNRGGTERNTIAWALNQGVIILSALPQDDIGGISGTIGELNGVIGVQKVGPDGRVPGQGQSGEAFLPEKVTVAAPGWDLLTQGDLNTRDWAVTSLGSGTSFATPITAGVLAAVWSKYPEATANQVVQSLIANAVPGGPELGYGMVNLPAMVADDPTRYPDVNPLIVPNARFDGDLSAADIAAATEPPYPIPTPPAAAPPEPGPTATAGAQTAPEQEPPGGGVPGWVWGLVVAVVASTAVGVVIGVRRAARA